MKFIGQHIWCWVTRFKNNVFFTKPVTHENTITVSPSNISEVVQTNLKPLFYDADSGAVVTLKPANKTPGMGNTVADLGDDTSTIDDAEIAGGITTATPTGNRTKPTDTAANIIANANMNLTANGNSFEFVIVNEAAATHKITLSAGTGVTLKGDPDVGAKTSATFRIVRTSSTAVTIYRK
jgi:hypothetical protein